MSSGKLKPGWTRVAFGDVVCLSRERAPDPEAAGFTRYVGLEHIDPDDLTIRRWGNVSDGTTFTNVFRPGQVLFGKRRAYLRKVAVPDFSGVCSGDIYVLESKEDRHLLPDLLPFICQTDAFFEHAVGTSAGSLSPRTNWRSLATYEFALPSLAEQRRIAKTMTAVSVTNSSLHRVLETSIDVEHSFLSKTFGNYGTCPAGTELVALCEVAEIRTGLAKGRSADASTTTRPYLRVANVKDGGLDLQEIKDIVVRNDQIRQYSLQYGDVLMTEGGDLDKLGRGSVWQEEIDGCLHQNHVYAVRPNLDHIDPWYLAAIVRSQYGRQFFVRRAKRTSNLASVNKKEVSEFKIPMKSRKGQDTWLVEYQRIRNAIGFVRGRLGIALKLKDLVLTTLSDKLTGSDRKAAWVTNSR